MSILIKGMEMPKSCASCPMLEGDKMDGLCHAASRWLDDDEYWTWYVYPEGDMDYSKPCNCPIVPVPPHGRLLDENKIFEMLEVQREDEYNKTHRPKATWSRVMDCFEDLLGIVDTAIPAEEGE